MNHVRRGSGEPLLLLHSLGGSLVQWSPVMGRLSEHRDVIAVDMPGFGDSPPLPDGVEYTAANLAGAVLAFYESLGLGRPGVAGISLGGWTAIECARQGGASAVVGICPAGFWKEPLGPKRETARTAARALRPLVPLLRTKRMRRVALSSNIHHPERVSAVDAMRLVRGYADATAYSDANRHMRGEVVGDLSDVRVPMTLAWAEFDTLVRNRPFRNGVLPKAVKQVALPDCGHVPTWDDPDLVARVVLEGTEEAGPVSERDGYNPGEFCWVELAVPDPDAAAAFYGDLIGWERERYEPDPQGYWHLRHNGKLVAGLEGLRAEGQVPAWLGYVRVDDAAESARKVGDAGGSTLTGPLDVPGGAGTLAVCQDAEGAVFALWQPGDLQGAELVNEVGCWTWNNLMSRDLDKAKDFYGTVFGWEPTQSDEQPPGIFNWQLDGQRWPEGLGGLMEIGGDVPAEIPPHWQVYFGVESAEGAMEQVNRSGGATLLEPLTIPVGQLAVFNDPQGANFAIFESHYPEER